MGTSLSDSSNDRAARGIGRRSLLGAGAAGALALALPSAASADGNPAGRPRPNIVLVLADDLGYGELGAYGQQIITTPRIDQLAAEGLRFTDAYAAAAVCAPSRSALLTGLHAGHGPVRGNPAGDDASIAFTDSDTTFAEVLHARGYRTGLFGKWGFGPELGDQPSHPNARGFDEFLGYITHSHAHDYYPTYLWQDGERLGLPENADGAQVTYAPDLFQDRALTFIRAYRSQPFLLVVTPNIPHGPSDVPSLEPYATQPWTKANRGHAAQVTRLDTYVGQLIDELAAQGLLESTVVLITSDNGPHEENGVNPELFDGNGPLKGFKRNLFEGGIRIPLIAWAPGRIQPGVTGRITQQTDLLPTLADLAGVRGPADIDGRSFRSLLDPQPAPAAEQPYLYFWRLDGGNYKLAQAADSGRLGRAAEAVREGDWKAIRWAPGKDRTVPDDQWQVELYDLAQDLGETTDLAAVYPDVATRLVGLMRQSWVDDVVREGYGVALETPQLLLPGLLLPGVTYSFTGTIADSSTMPWTGTRLALSVPPEWTVAPDVIRGLGRVESGTKESVVWQVAIPDEDTTAAEWRLTLSGYAVPRDKPLAFRTSQGFMPPPPRPTADSYLSDLPWISAVNGWGPVERDTSNGKNGAGDGPPISFGGTVYAKGLGVHSYSEVAFHIGARVARFTAIVGIDDFSAKQSQRGNTIAEVWADDRLAYATGVLRARTGPVPVDVDLRGARLLRLIVRAADSGNSFNHTSWANAFVWLG
jgi:arylsulfatase A